MGQQLSIVCTHEQRAVGPITDEFMIVPAVRNHHSGDAERQSTIAAGPHLQPEIGFPGRTGAARIDQDQARTIFEGLHGGGRMAQPGQIGVVAPEQDAASVLQVGHIRAGHPDAESVLGGQVATPGTKLHRGAQVWSSKGVHQALDPVDRVDRSRC